jgi:hypothetical protein
VTRQSIVSFLLRALQELLVQKTLAITQRYSHLAPEQLQNAVKLIDDIRGTFAQNVLSEYYNESVIPLASSPAKLSW